MTLPTKSAPNAVRIAYEALFPWSLPDAVSAKQPPYPGAFYGLERLIGERAARRSISCWLAGKRSAPRWLTKLLWDELQHRIDIARAAQAALEKYQHGPGTGCGLVAYHKKKKAARHEAASKSYPQDN